MILDIKNLPIDITLLHQIIIDLMEQMASLQEQLVILKAKRFGKSSEKLNKEIDEQIDEIEHRLEESEFLSEELAQIIGKDGDEEKDDENGAAETQTHPKQRPKRKKLPEHLERTNVVLTPDPICKNCGSEKFRTISEDISEVLEYIPSSFKVIRNIRPRCACINCETIVQAYPASGVIDKGKAGPGLLAHILVQKYCNHLPLYRQSQIYEREDIELSRSTMAGWASGCARLLQPLCGELKESIFSASQIHSDDTPVKVLAPGSGKTKLGRIWAYVRDGRPYGDVTPPAVCYFYSPDRKAERPESHLKDFKGTLHADAYSGYNKVYISDNNPEAKITEAACWAHTRRKFYEVAIANDKASIANDALEQISKIYKIEEEIRGIDPEERHKRRQGEPKDLVQKLFISWKKFVRELPKKSSTARAISYALNNEVALMRFLDDGKIEIDNNAAERAMRSIALGRKNWLFAGSDRGGETAAVMYSLIETAKLNNINPWKYLQKVLTLIQDHKSTKIAELLPWNLKLE
jgi:transposase